MNYQRLLPLALASALWLLSEIFFISAPLFYSALTLGLVLIVFSTKYLAEKNKITHWPLLIIAPILFWLACSLYVAIIPNFFWIQIIFLIEAWFVYSYFKNLYFHLAYAAPERLEKIDNLLLAGGFLGVFALGSSLYGLTAFINAPFLVLLAAFCPLAVLFFVQFLAFQKNTWPSDNHFFLIIIILLIELAGALSLLPLNFNILGLLLALIYYFLLTAWRLFQQGELNLEKMKFPLILSAAIITLLFLSSRWL